MKHQFASIVFMLVMSVIALAEDNVFTDKQAGFALSKPGSWFFLTPENMRDNRARFIFSDPMQKALFIEQGRMPLVVIAKYEAASDSDGFAPSVSVMPVDVSAYDGFPLSTVMAHHHVVVRTAGRGFKYLKPPTDMPFHGQTAGYSEMRHTVEGSSGDYFEVHTRLWLIPRQGEALAIVLSAPEEGLDQVENEFDEILEAIELF